MDNETYTTRLHQAECLKKVIDVYMVYDTVCVEFDKEGNETFDFYNPESSQRMYSTAVVEEAEAFLFGVLWGKR